MKERNEGRKKGNDGRKDRRKEAYQGSMPRKEMKDGRT